MVHFLVTVARCLTGNVDGWIYFSEPRRGLFIRHHTSYWLEHDSFHYMRPMSDASVIWCKFHLRPKEVNSDLLSYSVCLVSIRQPTYMLLCLSFRLYMCLSSVFPAIHADSSPHLSVCPCVSVSTFHSLPLPFFFSDRISNEGGTESKSLQSLWSWQQFGADQEVDTLIVIMVPKS
jgi:hypothetical protein